MFKKAEKKNLKLRMALCGPAGAGKTYSALAVASAIGGKIAVVDTEHGSASKYADIFTFDVVEPNLFDPRDLIDTIRHAEKNGYAHIIIDSLSHYWSGKGGELDMVDNAAARSKSANTFMAWKTVTPVHNELIDTIISCKINVFATMRTKTEYVIETNAAGKQVPRKVGLAPVMRDGIEYEFDLCGDIDQENNFVVTKSRCPELSGRVINRPGKQMAEALVKWLASGVIREEPKPETKPETKTETPPPPAEKPQEKQQTLAEKLGFNGGKTEKPEFSPENPPVSDEKPPENPQKPIKAFWCDDCHRIVNEHVKPVVCKCGGTNFHESVNMKAAQEAINKKINKVATQPALIPTTPQTTTENAGDIAAEVKQIRESARKYGCKTIKDFTELMHIIIGKHVPNATSLDRNERTQVLEFLNSALNETMQEKEAA